jgi:DNA-binding CsgD family transcriptional regulator
VTGAFGDMVDEPGFWPWADLYANALVMEGRLQDAETFLAPRERAATARGHRSAIARLAAPRGRLLGANGDLEGARRAFELALDVLIDLPLEHDRARVYFAYGQTLRRAGRRRDAELMISQARQLFSALGAGSYVARCDRELGASEVPGGGRLAELLTVKERLVASQAALGRSNREIASELYISEKTVQYHLTRIYAKSGVRSRTALAAVWLDDEGDVDRARADLA